MTKQVIAINHEIVSTHSRPKAAGNVRLKHIRICLFQHTAARRRLVCDDMISGLTISFQHTAARRRLDREKMKKRGFFCFNTQPPEGGWMSSISWMWMSTLFQHTAARRRLERVRYVQVSKIIVSTHSRPKAAGQVGR